MRRLIPLLLAWSTAALAADKAAAPNLKTWQLPNGLTVYYVPEHKAPVVSVQVAYHVGGKDEPADKRGIAHMFEHMMFKGSKHVPPEEHARFINSVGGQVNAFTTDDVTLYWNTLPPAALDFALQLEAERMRNLLLTQKTVDSEREVVKEELRLRLENNPIAKAVDKVTHLAYQVHPYQQSPIGEKKMLDTVTPADCQKFYDIYYRPNNAMLIVAGDVDEQTVHKLVEKHFGPLEAGPEPPRPAQAKQEPPQTKEREATLKLPTQLPVVVGSYHIPSGSSEDVFALEVLQQILAGGESSRMYQRLVRKDKLAVAAGGFVRSYEDPGTFTTYAVFLPGSDVGKIKTALAEEIAKVTSQAVDPKELEKAKNQLASRAVFQRERAADIATQVGVEWVVSHDPLHLFTAPQKYDAVTADDVQRVAQKYLVDTNFSQVTLEPAKGGPQKAPPAAAQPAKAPPAKAPAQQQKGGAK